MMDYLPIVSIVLITIAATTTVVSVAYGLYAYWYLTRGK